MNKSQILDFISFVVVPKFVPTFLNLGLYEWCEANR